MRASWSRTARRAGCWSRTRAGLGVEEERRAGMCPHGAEDGQCTVARRRLAALVESEPSVLPGCALTESCQSLHVAPDRAGIRLVLLRQRVRLRGLLLRQIESLHDRIEHRVTRRTELQGDGPQEQSAIDGRVGVEGRANGIQAMSSTRPESTLPRAGAGSQRRAENPR